MRLEVWRKRLLASLFGNQSGDDIPEATFPYFQPRMTREEERQLRENTDAALVWDGTRHVWK